MRDYNDFKTKVQDYMEYFCRRNDPANIESIVNDLITILEWILIQQLTK